MSKRVILALASATVLSAAVPGVAGYVTAQFEALDQARRELARLQAQLRMLELNTVPAAARCGTSTGPGRPHVDANGRQLPIPPRTDGRPWQNGTFERVAAPAIWTSVIAPGTTGQVTPRQGYRVAPSALDRFTFGRRAGTPVSPGAP